MIRVGLVIFCVFCVATLMAQGLGVSILWYRGQLTAENVKEIRMILSGQDPASFDLAEESDKVQSSTDDIKRDRSIRLLELETRVVDVVTLSNMLDGEADRLSDQQKEFEKQKKDFEQRLQQLQILNIDEAIERSRGILQASRTPNAVKNLMGLALKENITLLKGMPEKSIAKILQEFAKGAPKEVKRGQEIFETLSQGEPQKKLIGDAIGQLPQETPALQNQ